MKEHKYHVYGMGNALVDINLEVSPNTLGQLNIEKGVMTLIEPARENELIDHFKDYKHHKTCGGSAANTMITLSHLGGKGFYSCKVANDDTGKFFHDDLITSGLHTNLNHDSLENGITGKSIILVTPDADRTMNTHLGITYRFSKNELNESAIANSQYIYIEGYLVASPTAYEAMLRAKDIAKQSKTKISLTLSDLNMVRGFKKELLQVMSEGIDLLFCNEEEALDFCQTNRLTTAIADLKSLSDKVAITRGEKGALIFDGHQIIEIPAPSVNVIDTVGAGDIFAGAFLYGITHQLSFSDAARLANDAASKVVTKFGPRLNANHYEVLQSTHGVAEKVLQVG